MLVLQSVLLSIGINTLEFVKNIVELYLYNEKSDFQGEKIIEINSQKTCACTLNEQGLKFWPPLYMQRYMVVQEILEHPIWNGSIKKVLDYGCAELAFFKCIKPVPGLNNIMLVDIDFNTLDVNQTKVLPTTYDYLSMSERKEPMIVDIYNGSIAELDDRMLGVDAVICIELIEHLCLNVLDAVPYTVFEFIKPKLAVFTTPNVEFNILFPNFYTQFRHYDHKFEWTRKQFNAWTDKIISRYPDYAVQIDGIGAGPSGTEKLGCCSQMAIFYRKDMKTSPADPVGCTPYKLLRRVNYPFNLTNEDTIRERTIYDRLRNFNFEDLSNQKYVIDDNMEIPLSIIMPSVSDCCSSIEELENIVGKLYQTKKNDQEEWVMIKAMSDVSSDEYKSDSDSLSNSSGQEFSVLDDLVNNHDDVEEDWDTTVKGTIFEESKLCYSTPMTKNQDYNKVNTTVFSNSDFYKTAIDYNESENLDMDISSSCNNSFIVDDCKVYQEFLTGRNSSIIDEEDIEIEETLTYDMDSNLHENTFTNNSYNVNNNIINDNTIIRNDSNLTVQSTHSTDTAHKLNLNNNNFSNESTNELNNTTDNQPSVCMNRTLLDESGYTENLLSTPDKEL